ncbi:MAG: cupin domain-containing protein [Nanoarchaeota archaeon]
MEYESLVKPPVSERLKSGRVRLKAGEEVGLHKTDEREELLVVLSGTLIVVQGLKRSVLSRRGALFIPRNVMHNVLCEEGNAEYIYVVSLL